ncbi:hypothetical protein LWI29_005375 [Acer saccharum]|uniref:Multiple C2 domain-containing protein n=1 Tax=Acer saccharum TaxID=4024 RepID=A0AA39T018_ACESA|nr:hypothetical protein LWI29_005375 [Acer saccharum]
MVAMAFGFYYFRHPMFRDRMPSPALNFFRRLPSLSDRIIYRKSSLGASGIQCSTGHSNSTTIRYTHPPESFTTRTAGSKCISTTAHENHGGSFSSPSSRLSHTEEPGYLAPYGVQIEDPPRKEKIDKGKAVAEERNRSQSWLGHSDEDSSRSTRTKRKDPRTTNELEEEESVSHKRYNGQRGRSSRKTGTPPRSSGSPLKTSRIQQHRKNPSARRHLHFDRSPAKDPEYMQEIRQIRDDMQRMERNHRET